MGIRQATMQTNRVAVEAIQEWDPRVEGLVADIVLPSLSLPDSAGTFPVMTREGMLKRATVDISDGSAYPRINGETEDATYSTAKKGAEFKVTPDTRAKFRDIVDVDNYAGVNLAKRLAREREVRCAAAVQNTSTFTGATLYTDISSSAPFATAASDVIGAIQTALEVMRKNGTIPNAMILTKPNLYYLTKNTAVLARFPGAALITQSMLEDALGTIFGIDTLIVASGVYDSAKEGQTYVGADIWSNTYVMLAKLCGQGSDLSDYGLGRTIQWDYDGSGDLYSIKNYEEPQSGVGTIVYQADHYVQEKILHTHAGHLLKVA